jgi:hypothetical protein
MFRRGYDLQQLELQILNQMGFRLSNKISVDEFLRVIYAIFMTESGMVIDVDVRGDCGNSILAVARYFCEILVLEQSLIPVYLLAQAALQKSIMIHGIAFNLADIGIIAKHSQDSDKAMLEYSIRMIKLENVPRIIYNKVFKLGSHN